MLGRIAAVEEQLSYVERVVGGEEEADRQDQEVASLHARVTRQCNVRD